MIQWNMRARRECLGTRAGTSAVLAAVAPSANCLGLAKYRTYTAWTTTNRSPAITATQIRKNAT
jgi:hypothetical protein